MDLPFAAHEIDGSLDVIQSSLQHFHMSPQQAMDEILHSNLRCVFVHLCFLCVVFLFVCLFVCLLVFVFSCFRYGHLCIVSM